MSGAELHHFWQQTLAEWTASGLSGAAFCKQQSLTYHQFVYWRRKLRGASESAGHGQEPASPAGFARVVPVAHGATADGLTVSLPGGVSITGLHA
ncbi:MAG: IS66 family insertion sequence element accessory protein TnpB, partial [Arhodomonas sp.]|nr:IS66 family insertion sequence element accessory protein TnpB [Arhodomonas sp.]